MPDWNVIARRCVLKVGRLTGLSRLASAVLSPFGAVFTLHHVRPGPPEAFEPNAHLQISPDFLESLIVHLKQRSVDLLDLGQAIDRIEAQPRSAVGRAFFVSFTLDDGYRDIAEHAAPIFRRHGVPYAVFVVAGFSGARVLAWWDVVETVVRARTAVCLPHEGGITVGTHDVRAKRDVFDRLSRYLTDALPEACIDAAVRALAAANGVCVPDERSQVMDWETLRRLAADPLCTIGAHGMGHARLSQLGKVEAAREIRRSREVIGERLGRRPDFFAYPYGSSGACGPRESELARRAGFRASFTTQLHPLTLSHTQDLQALPRLSLNGYHQDLRDVDVMMSGLPGLLKHRRR